MKQTKVKVYVRVMHMRWPLWFSNDFQDIEQIAPISESLKADAFALNELFANLTYWDSTRDGYRWKANENPALFNMTSRRFAADLQNQLGKNYEVLWPLAKAERENKDQLVNLTRKKVRRWFG
ncbi:MAG: hypothetical protein KA500_05075 [Rhodoluna sp.]|nr:hypothetical protein [Rhodoluna sp.]MBP6187008.1 hypothetical protein [Rhodoluna sp.]